MKEATLLQTPPELNGWSKFLDQTGLALGLLLVLLGLLWRLSLWIKPKANTIVDGILANSNRVPGLLEAQARAYEGLKAATDAQNILLAQLAERVSKQSDRTQLIAEHVSRQSDHIARLIERAAKDEK